jgi:ABC transport system ATP-binding/permease protein
MSDAFLKVLSGPRQGLNVPLSATSGLTIGRKRGDLVLNDSLLSKEHARIFAREDGWYVKDLQSTNGTMVDGKLISEERLRPGAEMMIGNTRLALFVGLTLREEGPKNGRTTSARLELAWLLDEELVEVRGSGDKTHNAADVIDKDLRIPPRINAAIEVVAGQDAGKLFPFSTGNVTIGRGVGEVPLTDLEVSRRHAVIEMFGRKMIFLRDLSSTNGTFHNGQRVDVSRLQHGDTVGIGRTVLRISLKP